MKELNTAARRSIVSGPNLCVTPAGIILVDEIDLVSSGNNFIANPTLVSATRLGSPASGSLNRNRNRNRNRNHKRNRKRNRSLNRNCNRFNADFHGGIAYQTPWREREILHSKIDDWINLPLTLPAPVGTLGREIADLREKAWQLRHVPENLRRDEIDLEVDLELSAYFEAIDADEDSFPETAILFYMVADLCEEIGLRYKARFERPRPSVADPRLRTYLPNPSHSSYPSNHALQSYAMALIFGRMHPEHPGITELFLAAQRVGENREWAGIHYASDTRAGRELARMLTPILELTLKDQMRRARLEWI